MEGNSVGISQETLSDLRKRIEALEREIESIERRNRRVEGDKAWETSLARHALVALITYLLATLVLWLISIKEPYLGALIPTLGYVLSTRTMEWGKRYWIDHIFSLIGARIRGESRDQTIEKHQGNVSACSKKISPHPLQWKRRWTTSLHAAPADRAERETGESLCGRAFPQWHHLRCFVFPCQLLAVGREANAKETGAKLIAFSTGHIQRCPP